jgi:PAS domain-containing protein
VAAGGRSRSPEARAVRSRAVPGGAPSDGRRWWSGTASYAASFAGISAKRTRRAPEWQPFLGAVNDAYHQLEGDRAMLERALELSSQELLDANTEMRAVLDGLPDLYFRLDAQGRVRDFRDGAATHLGRPSGEILGTAIDRVFPGRAVVVVTAEDLPFDDRLRLHGYVEKILQKGAYSREGLLAKVRELVAACVRHSVPAGSAAGDG